MITNELNGLNFLLAGFLIIIGLFFFIKESLFLHVIGYIVIIIGVTIIMFKMYYNWKSWESENKKEGGIRK